MLNKNEFNIINLKKSLTTLKECWQIKENNKDIKMIEIIADSCVKRFEYTLETSWKLMKKYLKLQYGKDDQELTLNNIFRLMEGYELIPDWNSWKNYYQERNNVAHEYNIEKSRKLIEIIPDFIKDTEILIINLEKNISD